MELARLGVTIVRGDVTDKESMREPMRGTDGVFHIAGWYKVGVKDKSDGVKVATLLLKQGVSIIDTILEAGYFDQAHLTRSMKYFIGQTPAQILRQSQPEQLSFLYKTRPFR